MKPNANILDSHPLLNSSRRLPYGARLVWFLVFLGIWYAIAETGAASSLIVPHPTAVWRAAENIGWTVWLHAAATFLRTVVGFVVGSTLGVAVGCLVQFSPAFRSVVEPFLDASRPVPALALLPFFILIFGFSELGRFVLIILSVAVFVAIATIEAMAKVPEAWVRFARVSGLPRREVFASILLPGSAPWLVGPMRLALATAFTLAIASEFMGAQYGLGYLINTARVNLATQTIWLAVLILGLICQAADIALVSTFKAATRWYQSSDNV